MKTVIYTQRVEVIEEYQERRDAADQRIADFIDACGFLPLPVPNRKNLAEKIIERIQPSGIVLTGGNSLLAYGGNAPERDDMDEMLIQLSIQRSIPLYGFCRGMQSILSHFGNQLINIEGHTAVHHYVKTEIGNEERYIVNSYHNQACIELQKDCGICVTERADDGVIEGIRHETFPITGTMWHPERENKFFRRDIERIKRVFNNWR